MKIGSLTQITLFFAKCFLLSALLLVDLPVFAQVDNDECASATLLGIGNDTMSVDPIFGTTMEATASGVAGGCNPQAKDVWYRFVATASAHTLSITRVWYNQPADFFFETYSGTCGNLQLQQFYCMGNGSFDVHIGDLLPGATYFIRVGHPTNLPIGFYIALGTPSIPPPANDACANAHVLPVYPTAVCDSTVAGTLAGASVSAAPFCKNCYPVEDVWYRVVATQTTMAIQLSDITDDQQRQRTVAVFVYTGVCGQFVDINRRTAITGQGLFLLNNLEAGQTYYLRVFDSYSNPFSPIHFNICATTPLPLPNEGCAGALPMVPDTGLYCTYPITGSLYGAAVDSKDCKGRAVSDAWYQFVATSTSHRITLTPIVQFFQDTTFGFEVLGSNCANPVSLACDQTGELVKTVAGLTIGDTYFVRVFSDGYESYDFQLCLNTLPQPPTNDDCAGALPLSVNADLGCEQQSNGSTLGATSSFSDCNDTESTHDVWYSFVATSVSQRMLVNQITNILGDYYHFGCQVYSGNCGGLTALACRQMSPTNGGEILLGPLVPGDTYYVRVYSIAGSNHEFSICLQTLPAPPPNIDCAHAETLHSGPIPDCSAKTSGNTTGIVTLSDSNCGGFVKELWYSFTATQAIHTVQVSEVESFLFGGDYWIAFYEGTGCDSLHALDCYNNPLTVYLQHLTVGKTYYLRWMSAGSAGHTFNLCLGYFLPPANDDCADAQWLYPYPGLTCNNYTAGTTVSGTAGQADSCFAGVDVWYTFRAIRTTQRLAVNFVSDLTGTQMQPLKAEFLSGDCGQFQTVYCWPNAINGNETLFIGDLVPDQQYYLRVAGPDGIPVRFQLCLLTPPPPPVNDNCANATLLIPQPGSYCAPILGNTANATPTNRLPMSGCCGEGDLWYKFVAAQANHTVVLSEVYQGALWNLGALAMELYADSCTAATLLAKEAGYSGTRWLLSHLTPGATYHLRVYPQDKTDLQFKICIQTPGLRANDACANALPLPVNEDLACVDILYASTEGATQSLPDCGGKAANDVWFQFKATATGYRFDAALSGGTGGPWGYEIFAGTCDQPVSIRCIQKTELLQIDTLEQYGFIPEETYYLRFFSSQHKANDFTLCTRSLPASPVNDACTGAMPLTVNPAISCELPVLGSTLGADRSESACFGNQTRDVWYRFTATHAAHILYVKATKAYFGTEEHFGYQLFSGDCNKPIKVHCQDKLYQDAIVIDSLTPGQTYFLQLISTEHSAHDFSICISTYPPPPANDGCAQAITALSNPDLHCNRVTAGTTIAASFVAPEFNTPDVWYRFTPLQSTHFFQLTNLKTLLGQAGHLRYQIFWGDSCSGLRFLYNLEPTTQSQINDLHVGETYFIRVFSTDARSAYSFDLCIKSFPPPPSNDDCAGALPLPINKGTLCNVVEHGTTAGVVGSYTTASGYLELIYDLWYSFTATSPNHQIRANNLKPVVGFGNGYFQLLVYAGDSCSNIALLGGTAFEGVANLRNLMPGKTYYVAAISRENVLHEFDICLTTDSIPNNDLCEKAFSLPVSPTAACEADMKGTTVSASPSPFESGCDVGGNDVWYSFTATQSAHTISVRNVTTPSEAKPSEFSIGCYGGSCGHLQNLACRYNLVGADSFQLGDLLPGARYFIRIGELYNDLNFHICVSTPPLPPANDACAGALPLTVSSNETCEVPISGTTENATPSPLGIPYYGPNNPAPTEDVWYVFRATQANHIIKYYNINASRGSISPEVYRGDCDSLIKVTSFLSYSNEYELLLAHLTPGALYFVRVFEPDHGLTTFDLCITSPPMPSNDECGGVIPLMVNPDLVCQEETTASTLGATQSMPGCSANAVNDVWFKFTATGSSQRLSFTLVERDGFTDQFGMEILEGDCNAFNTVVPCAEYNLSLQYIASHLKAGKTYYIRLYALGDGWLKFKICVQSLPEPPANDVCAQAQWIPANTGITCDLTHTGTTLGATQSALSCSGGKTHDVWYRFTATSAAHLVEAKATDLLFDSTHFWFGLQAYRGNDCTNLDSMLCIEKEVDISMFLEGLTIGETYYLRVFSPQNDAHGFSLCIRTLPPSPVNVACVGALPIVPSPNLNCDQPVRGNTANLTDTIGLRCLLGTSLWYQFTATDYTHFIDFKNIVNFYGDANLGLELYGGRCDSLVLLACSDAKVPIYTYSFLNPGASYFIRVVGTLHAGNQFDLCLLTPVPPANDDCAGIVMLPVSPAGNCTQAVAGSNLGATPSTGIFCYSGPDVLYAFVATATEHTVRINHVSPDIDPKQTYMEALAGTCDQWNAYLGCFRIDGDASLRNLVPGQTYYLRLGSYYSTYFNFDICITTPRPHVIAYNILLPFEGCKPGTKEKVDVVFTNFGDVKVPIGAAEFTLTLSGANTGTYGPIPNVGPFQTNAWFAPIYWDAYVATFTDVDFSKLGETRITASVTYRDGVYMATDSMDLRYLNQPPYYYYCPVQAFDEDEVIDRGTTAVVPLQNLHIFPNPASTEAQVAFMLENDANTTLSLWDAAGRLVQSTPFAGRAGMNQYRCRLDELLEGVYTVQVMADGYKKTGKLVVLRP